MSSIDFELILSSLDSMHIPGRFCYLCNKKEAKQNKRLTDCQVFIYNLCTLNVKLYYHSKIIIFFENLFPGLTGSGAENLFIQYYRLHNCILDFTNISVVSSLIRKLRLLSFQFRRAWITFLWAFA